MNWNDNVWILDGRKLSWYVHFDLLIERMYELKQMTWIDENGTVET